MAESPNETACAVAATVQATLLMTMHAAAMGGAAMQVFGYAEAVSFWMRVPVLA